MKIKLEILLVGMLSVFAMTCSHSKPAEQALTKEGTAPISKSSNSTRGLTREMALTRARQIGRVSYSLWFGLGYEHEDFDGRATLNFDLKPKSSEIAEFLLIDFLEGSLKSLSINGQPQSQDWLKERYDGSHIHLRLSELNTGSNRVEIGFLQKYSRNGNGLHRFTDPEDKQIYIYSNLEPYNARRVFPCFDQPDLKASFEVTAEVPTEWNVISNVAEREVLKVGTRRSWAFPPSPLFSTYLFALMAGPYADSKFDASGVPVRVFSRKSLKPFVDSADIFKTTEKGLEFYAQEFGTAYPFPKLDLIFVPEFNVGGMENVGAITLSERNIFRSRASSLELLSRQSLILHEIAHMWFGNLVTMRWWNGIWLNESFATFASHLALEKAGLSPYAWEQFLASMKLTAYQEDRLETTHPVELSVPDTDHAFANFDGITYGKGASVLKQLRFYIGEDDFREGMFRYFQKFSFRNASLTDLIRNLGEASGANLVQWQQQWLQSAGMNRLTPEINCDAETGMLLSLKIKQENLTYSKELRTHKTRVAFYTADKKGLYAAGKEKTWDVTLQKETNELPGLKKEKCPAFVLINDDDYAYASVRMDPKSLAFALQNTHRFSNPLSRLNITAILWDMMLDQSLAPKDFSETLLKGLETEKNLVVLKRLQSWAFRKQKRASSVYHYLPENSSFRGQLEKLALAKLQDSRLEFDAKALWFRFFTDVAFSTEAAEKIDRWLAGKSKISGFVIEKDRRWALIQALAQTGSTAATGLIASELALDSSHFGKSAALTARTLFPSAENKKQAWNQILQAKGFSTNEKQVLLGSLWTVGARMDNVAEITEQYRTELKRLNEEGQSDLEDYIEAFAAYGYPLQCTQESIKQLEDIADSISKIRPTLKKELSMLKSEEVRCVKLRTKP